MCEGPIFKKLIIYSLPLMATFVLQLVFNATDIAVLGILVGDDAVAAVGSTGAIINLMTCLFTGISVGANVVVARFSGAQNTERARKSVGCAVISSLLFGVFLVIIGILSVRSILEWTKCDPAVIDMAATYLKIYFLGMPIVMLYNFCAAILRAVGDTKRPMVFLCIGGVINVVLNVFFILVCNMTVEGVAIATVISQLVSAILSLAVMLKETGYSRLEFRYLRIYKDEFFDMLKIGIPSGIQTSMFSISNLLIQSAFNELGKTVMAGNTVASQLDGFIYNAMYAVAAAAISFTGQNYGAGRIDRIKKIMWRAMILSAGVGMIVGGGVLLFDRELCSIISDDPAVIEVACTRILILGGTYYLCGIMDVCSSIMRGLGKSAVATLVCLIGSCLFRILWLETVYLLNPCVEMIYIVYPISWLLTIGIYLIIILPMLNRLEKQYKPQEI